MSQANQQPSPKRCVKCGEMKPLSEFYYKPSRDLYETRCNACIRAANREYYESHGDQVRAQARRWAAENADHRKAWELAYGRRRHLRNKRAALAIYGERCACCGEAAFEFLTIDHIDNDGHIHRREIGGRNIYEWLKNNGYPSDRRLQTLCFNCNFAKRYNGGICPHQREGSETIPSGSRPKRVEAGDPSTRKVKI